MELSAVPEEEAQFKFEELNEHLLKV